MISELWDLQPGQTIRMTRNMVVHDMGRNAVAHLDADTDLRIHQVYGRTVSAYDRRDFHLYMVPVDGIVPASKRR